MECGNHKKRTTQKRASHIRLATCDDAAKIRAIYAPYVATPTTFEETVPTTQEFRTRIANTLEKYPYLVAEQICDDNKTYIVGYAYAHKQAERAAYGWNAETSVYVAPSAQRCGLGSALYDVLLELLCLMGVKMAYAKIAMPNVASEHLHATFGFDLMGVQNHAGYTCGTWHDVAWMTKPLGKFENNPTPVKPFSSVYKHQKDAVQSVLERANARN